ncbi:hypothetical protein [Sciscionella sediminilitoris]|uniref:hypothetical protein n=1 Tax=Sciscionella sediminilitoris TaxID=1445613 RepID=UPI00068D3EDA|nr:hypothetical protein [Sciscionella sp. SE31]
MAQRSRFWPWTLARIVLTVLALAVILEPVLAGRFLAGDYPMLGMHEVVARVVLLGSVLLIPITVLAWRIAGSPGWLAFAAVALTVLVLGQTVLGYTRAAGVHIPLGVAILVLTCRLTWLVYTKRPAECPSWRAEPEQA